MIWTSLCRRRMVMITVMGCLLLRLLIGLFNTSLQSMHESDNQSTLVQDVSTTKSGNTKQRLSFRHRKTGSENASDDPLSEITLSVADLEIIKSTRFQNSPRIAKNFTEAGVSDNVINRFRYDANRALISKEDLEAKSKNSDLNYINKFLKKNLNKGRRKMNIDSQPADIVGQLRQEENDINMVTDIVKLKYNDGLSNAKVNPTRFSARSNDGSAKHVYDKFPKPSASALKYGIYTNEQNQKCKGNLLLVVTVFSTPQNIESRNAIRETWGGIVHKPKLKTQLFFVLGKPKPLFQTTDLPAFLETERKQYRDILLFNFTDSHENLTLKSVQTLDWAETRCPNAKYLLKTDEDVFINVPSLLQELATNDHSRFITGHLIENGRPLRDRRTRYYTPEEIFPGKTYPRYMSGTAYVISGDLIHDLNIAIQTTKLFWLEDVYITGMCAPKVNANLIDNRKFNHSLKPTNPCLFRFLISSHGMNAASLRRAWQVLHMNSADCADTTSHVLE